MVVLAALLVPAPSRADLAGLRPLIGSVVLARNTNKRALFIWDATQYVIQLRSDKIFGDDALHAIEATAATALADKSKILKSTSVALRITYARTGAVSPVYGSPTFAGIEAVLTLSADRAALGQHGPEWATSLARGTVPAGVAVDITGTLPPQ